MMRSGWQGWREFCVGGVGGALLSIARPPAGIALEEWMTPTGERQALWRAGALIVVALGWIARRPRAESARFPALEIALGSAAGFAIHGLVFADLAVFDATWKWGLALVAGLVAMLALGSGEPDAREPDARESGARESGARESVAATPLAQRFTLALCGGGLALVFSALSSRLCLLGAGTRADETIFGATALILFAVGVFAFAPLLRRLELAPTWFALGLCAAALFALPSLEFLGTLAMPRAYLDLLSRFGLDTSMRGSLTCDGLLALRVFALPALCAGAAFAALRSASSLGWAMLGAAVAVILQPHWLGGFDASTVEAVAIQGSERAAHGAEIAALGALLTAVVGASGAWRSSLVIALGSGACLLLARTAQPPPVLPLSPWGKIPPRVEWIRETPEGLLTVELQGGRGRVVTLDRRLLTPTVEDLPADELRWRCALEQREALMLLGWLTPERALLLSVLGVTSVQQVTPWPELESDVLALLLGGSDLPVGLLLDRDGMRWRATDIATVGSSCMIVGPPVEVAARATACVEDRLCALGWIFAHGDSAQVPWGGGSLFATEQVIASCTHIEDLCFAVCDSPSVDWRGRQPAGSRALFGTLAQVLRSLPERERAARVAGAERLARGGTGAAARAAALIAAAQVPSSPFESRAQRTELDSTALELLRVSGLAAEPAGFERQLDESVADVLEGRRDLDGLDSFARPLADAHPTWPRLQRSAARADWEFLDWASCASRLERVVQSTPYDLQARLWLSDSLLRAGESSAALQAALDLLAIQPGRFDAERLRAIAAVRAGDPRSGSWLTPLLREHPEDPELAIHARPGPYPPMTAPLSVPGELAPSADH